MGIPREAKRFRGLRQIGMLTPVLIDEAREVGSSFCMARRVAPFSNPSEHLAVYRADSSLVRFRIVGGRDFAAGCDRR